jgi:hypothetical protein
LLGSPADKEEAARHSSPGCRSLTACYLHAEFSRQRQISWQWQKLNLAIRKHWLI